MPAEDALEPGETILALATGQPAGAIERQARKPVRVVVTDRRFLALKTSAMTGRSKGEVEFEIPLRDITSVETRKRHPIATIGVPVFGVGVTLADGQAIALESSGVQIKKLRNLAEVLRSTAQAVEGSQYFQQPEAAGDQ
jgi:Bacterial PH domain